MSTTIQLSRRLFLASALAGALAVPAWAAEEEAPAKPSRKQRKAAAAAHVYPTLGQVERLDPALDALIAPGTPIEKLAAGFKWSEGPVWVRKGGYLLFSDVPNNVVFRWKEGQETQGFIHPSGYTGSNAGEQGSNGLMLDKQGRLILCQHGDRQVARWENGKFTPLARYYKFRRFNSPNDLVYKSNGDLYFTDPPYGLKGMNNDPAKELNYSGVFRLTPSGDVTLLTSNLSFPNGIALSPDEKTLYVAVSDPKRAVLMAYGVKPDGTVENERVFADLTSQVGRRPGLPDGLKVDKAGNLWATGPGGVLVFAPDGKHLGTIDTGEPTANCAFGDDGSTLYITSNMYLCRIKTLTKGLGF